jgi:hypothetical protein
VKKAILSVLDQLNQLYEDALAELKAVDSRHILDD